MNNYVNFHFQGQSQKELYKKHHNTADGRIRVWFGIRQIMNATERLLIETRDNAIKLETGIHMVLLSSLLTLLQSRDSSNYINGSKA